MRQNKKKKLDLSTFEGQISKQGYHKVGSHSAAKICKYAKDGVLGKEGCYKNKFYGISSHRCLQCSPTLQFCNLCCKFCWRLLPEFKGGWMKMPSLFEWDTPVFIIDGLIHEQKKIMSGFFGNEKANREFAKEAMEPRHAAISLIGEPVLYPKLSELIEEFHKRKMTTFLVTNGTFPNKLMELKTLPTQLYISLVAPDEKTYANVTQQKPTLAKSLWKNYLSSLDFLASVSNKTRTVLRMTLVRKLNDDGLENYAKLILFAQPHYVEVKSFVFVGGARNEIRGLKLSDMFSIDEIRKIASKLAELTGYIITDEHIPSRVVLLSRDEKAEKERILQI